MAVAALTALLILAPSHNAQTQEPGGSLVYAERESAGSLNPLSLRGARGVTDRLFSVLFESLYRYDYTLERYEPLLARGVEAAADGRSADVHLRDDVTWHDGSTFHAADVVASYQEVLDGEAAGLRSDISSLVDRVEEADAGRVRFHFTEPVAEPEQLLDLWILSAEALESARDELDANPVGTGPFRFVDRTIEGNVELARFEDYHDGPPYLEGLEMRLSSDVNTMTMQLLADILGLVVDLPPANLLQVEAGDEHRIMPYQSYSIYTIAFNLDHPILSVPELRRAMTQGFDREGVLDQWFDGRGELLAGPVVPAAPFFNSDLDPVPHDPAGASSLLDEAGFESSGSTETRTDADGNPLEFTLLLPRRIQAAQEIEQNVGQDFVEAMARLGIQINLENVSVDEYQRRVFQERDYDLAWVAWTFDPIYDISPLFHSRNDVPGGSNITGYENETVDQYLDDYAEEQDPAQRRNLMNIIQGLLARDLPYQFLFTVDRHAAVHNRFAGIEIDPYYFFTYVRDWHVLPEFR